MTATATRQNRVGFQGSTSEVSAPVAITRPGVIEIAAAPASIEEGETARVVVRRSGGSEGVVTVRYVTFNSTAVSPDDYEAQDGTLTFAQGVTEQEISIATVNDAMAEGPESFTFLLFSPGGGARVGEADRTLIVIDANAGVAIPTLSTWMLVGVALALATIGLRTISAR